MKQREIVNINEEILDLKEKLEKVTAESKPEIERNQKAAREEAEFSREFTERLKKIEAGHPDEKFISDFVEPHIKKLHDEAD